jgi:hypothetical protein
VRKGDDLTTFTVPKVMKNLEALTFRIPKGLLRAVVEKLSPLPLYHVNTDNGKGYINVGPRGHNLCHFISGEVNYCAVVVEA